jgi:hypothetical protein
MHRHLIWLGGVVAATAVVSWVLIANIHISPAHHPLPIQELAPSAFLRMFGVAAVGFCGLWWTGLAGRRLAGILGTLGIVLAASLVAGSLALIGDAAPRAKDQSDFSRSLEQLRKENSAIIHRYTVRMRAIDPETWLSPFNLRRSGDLTQAKKAVADARVLVDQSRQAYARTLFARRADISGRRAKPADLREALAHLDADHADLATYWSLQEQYVGLLEDLLAITERSHWRVREASLVFDVAADQQAYEDRLVRLASLSKSVEQDIARRDPQILP